jgi:hypothetical protein
MNLQGNYLPSTPALPASASALDCRKDHTSLSFRFWRSKNPLKKLEQTLEQVIEAPINRVFQNGTQPAEIGRRLEREMRSSRVYSVGSPLVANVYEVQLNPVDREAFAPYRSEIEGHLAEWLQGVGMSEGFSFLGPVSVELVEQKSLGRGMIDVKSTIRREDAPAPQPSTPPEHLENLTMPYEPRVGSQSTVSYRLMFEGGHMHGQQFPVGAGFTTVGRHQDNDILIEAIQVSRFHARFESFDDIVRIVDLGSTNGTFVNGRRINDWTIVGHGDRIIFGTQEAILTDPYEAFRAT